MIREEHLVPVGPVETGGPEAVLAVTVAAPAPGRLADPAPVYFCIPGGGLDRRYYDLRACNTRRFSFAEQMAERGIFFTPTMLVYEYHRRSPQPHVRERAEALQEAHVVAIRRALELGVRVVAGTDAGGHGHPANAGELDCLVKAGMSPMQALQAATGWAAECLGWEDRLGTVESGKLADLIVLDADPLADIRNSTKIRWVVKNGEVFEGLTLKQVWPQDRPLPRMFWAARDRPASAAN